MKRTLTALTMLSFASVAQAEEYRVYNGLGLGETLDQVTTAAENANMLVEKSSSAEKDIYYEVTAGFGMDPNRTDVYSIYPRGSAARNAPVVAFLSSGQVIGLIIEPEWFGARGMSPQQIAQNIADNYQIEELSFGPCSYNRQKYCWATVTETGEKIYITEKSGTLITLLSKDKPTFN